MTPGRFIYKKPRTFEESVAIFQLIVETVRGRKLIDKEAPICVVFDSLAAMVPQSILVDSKGKARSAEDRNMNDNTALARATSAHFPAISMLAEEHGACVIFLNQLRNKIGVMFGDPRRTTGGDSPAFYFSQRLWLSASQIKLGDEVIGMEVTGSLVKNKIARPYHKAKWRFMFQKDGTGRFDAERSLVEFLNDQGLLPTKDASGKEIKKGFVLWDGKQIGREALARQIEQEGAAGFAKLKALLPPAYEPETLSQVEIDSFMADDDEQPAEAA